MTPPMNGAITGLLLTASLCACGQTGELYLPDAKPAASEQPAPKPEEKKEEKPAVVPLPQETQ